LTLPDPDDAQIPGWAEGPNENTDDPEIYRERGYQDPDSFASADLNKNLQQIYRWIDTALEGGAARLTGDYGEVEIGNDDSSLFELVINAGSQGLANLTSWALDQIKVFRIKGNGVTFIEVVDQNDNASGFLLESLRAVTGINDLIKILDEDGNPGEGGVLLDILSAGTSDEIDVQSSSKTSGAGGFFQSFLRAPETNLGVQDVISVRSTTATEGDGVMVGRNTASAGAFIDFSGQTPTNGDTLNTVYEWGGLLVAYTGTGEYNFGFGYTNAPAQSEISGHVQLIGTDDDSLNTRIDPSPTTGVDVRVFDDAQNPTDPPDGKFLVTFYFPVD
jgi:hypothetical protein